ncbi:MAG: ABC transporter substrate-binding protein, partial [Crenarchaeota archaeon]|nr:ABC transporter substrate-binding protein [Thermoproteota archaeon]
MKIQHTIIALILVVIIISVSAYGAYTYLYPPSAENPSPSPTTTPSPTISSNPTSSASVTPTPTSTTLPTSSPSSSTQPTPTITSSPTVTPTITSSPTASISPTPTIEPTPTPTPLPVSVIIEDATGAQVNVTLPVERIVCLTGAETVYALGAGDKIVAISGMLSTDAKAILPSSITQLPVVGETDTAPNMELIIELEPNLVIASQRLSDANRKTLEDAGIAVIEDSSTGTRRNQFITNLGQILNAQQKVDDLLNFEQYYKDLVAERVANLTDAEKPTVYFEWYKAWFSSGPGGSYSLLIDAAGGINIAKDAGSANPQLNSEFVLEQNPDIIIRMLDYTSGEDYDAFQGLYESIFSRVGISDLTAAQTGQIHVIKSTLLVERDIIGLLYFAKWFHPTLFADIDPAAIHAQ